MDDLMVLKELFSRTTLNTMSGAKKKAFRYTLTAIFINLISGRQATQGQVGNIQLAYEIKESRLKKEQYVQWGNGIWRTVEDSLHKSHFKKPYNDELINRIIAFTRERLSEIEKEEVSLPDFNTFKRQKPSLMHVYHAFGEGFLFFGLYICARI